MSDDWATILGHIDDRLREAIAAADARTAEFRPMLEDSSTPARMAELEVQAGRFASAREIAARAQGIANDTDLALAVCEDLLRQRLAETQSIRQRLATWMARAIG